MSRPLIGALIGLLIGGAAAYVLFRPSPSPAVDPVRNVRVYRVPPTGAPRPVARRPAPDFDLPSLRGGRLHLSDFRGQIVLLNFFASWCAPCAAEVPELQRAYENHRRHGVVVLGVAILDEFTEAQAFLARHRLTYPAVFDQGNRMMERYQVVGLPTSVFIDPSGQITSRFVGPFLGPAGVAELERRLAEAGRR